MRRTQEEEDEQEEEAPLVTDEDLLQVRINLLANIAKVNASAVELLVSTLRNRGIESKAIDGKSADQGIRNTGAVSRPQTKVVVRMESKCEQSSAEVRLEGQRAAWPVATDREEGDTGARGQESVLD